MSRRSDPRFQFRRIIESEVLLRRDIRGVRTAESRGNEKRPVFADRLLHQFDRLAGHKTVPGVFVPGFENDPARTIGFENLFRWRVLGRGILADVYVPGARIFALVPRVEDLADLERAVAVTAEMFR